MADWTRIERDLIDSFRALGFKPKVKADWPQSKAQHNGEWFVSVGPTLNISELARQLQQRSP